MDKKILACDLDGVIYAFNKSYIKLFKEMFDIRIPEETNDFPNKWNYELDYASKPQVDEAWHEINHRRNYHFWRFLPPYEDAQEFLTKAQKEFNEIHFITSRSGSDCKRATEDALTMLGVINPNVVISHHKLPQIMELGATHFIDDRDKNFDDLMVKQDWRKHFSLENLNLFMLDRPWNRHYNNSEVKRIFNPMELLDGHS